MNPIVKFFKTEKKRKEILAMPNINLDKEIKIQGTQFDRKRHYTDADIKKWLKAHNSGMSISEISKKFEVSYATVKYNIDDIFRISHIKSLSGLHTGIDHITLSDRAIYKRNLLKKRKIKISI